MPSPLSFTPAQIEQVARVLGEAGTGGDITNAFKTIRVRDASGASTKWRRLDWLFTILQERDGAASGIIDFMRAFFTPVRFIEHPEAFEEHRAKLNKVLAFAGLEVGKDGRVTASSAVSTLDEAEARVKTLRSKFKGRAIHAEVLKYCTTELLQDNYFHAVFEAAKGLAQRIRHLSGSHMGGSALVDAVFSIERPKLVFSALQTETEKSEHKGFAMLLKGCFGAIRNPLAHKPKILWQGEEDAADYLSLISLLHRRLDNAVPTRL